MGFQSKIDTGRDGKRSLLYTVAPRKVPFSVGITPSDICNFRCVYCNQATPQGIKDARVLPWDDFLFLANQLEQLVLSSPNDRIKNIRFIGNGEPLINNKLPNMIAYLKQKNLDDRYEVTTNASLLTHDMSDRLIKSGITRLLISVQGISSSAYEKVCGIAMDMDKLIEQIAYFFKNRGDCQVFIKTVDVAVNGYGEKEEFYKIFSPYCDSINIENIMEACADVDYKNITGMEALDKTTRYGSELKQKICCDTLFMYLNIHSNGDVDCCGCKYPPHYVGNIYNIPLSKIWNGNEHKRMMIKHLKKMRWDINDCAKCSSIEHFNGFSEDNLDEHLDEVLARVEKLQCKR